MSGHPALEMLWEDADPALVLRERFGLAAAGDAARWVTELLARHWGVNIIGCERIVMSDANALAWVVDASGQRLVVKWSVRRTSFERLRRIAELTAWLGEHGLPVSAPVPDREGHAQVETSDVSVGVQRVVAGELLDPSDLRQVHATGATLARFHLALAEAPPGLGPACDSLAAPGQRVSDWLAGAPAHLGADLIGPLGAALPRLDALAASGGDQLVHGDVRSANVLWHDGAVAAFLDLEEMRRDLPVMELARSAVLLGTRFHDWGPVPTGVHDALREGYEGVRPLTRAEADAWPVLLLWQTLCFVPADADPTGWRRSALRLAGMVRLLDAAR